MDRRIDRMFFCLVVAIVVVGPLSFFFSKKKMGLALRDGAAGAAADNDEDATTTALSLEGLLLRLIDKISGAPIFLSFVCCDKASSLRVRAM